MKSADAMLRAEHYHHHYLIMSEKTSKKGKKKSGGKAKNSPITVSFLHTHSADRRVA